MNGDAQQIINKITEIATRQEERHTENTKILKVIFGKLEKLDELPCKVHIERMLWFNRYLIGLAGIVGAVITWMVKTHLVG